MKIVDVKTAVVEGNFDWPLVQIKTDEGMYGYGEVRDAGSKWLALHLKPYLIGEDPTDVERLFRKIRRFGGRGRQGGGVSGVEMALWDIAGKVHGVPVYKLLGGKFRDRIPIYCDCHAGKPIASRDDYQLDEVNYTPEAYAENARRIKKLGFNLLKFDLGANVASLAPKGYMNGQVTHAGLRYQVSIVEALRAAAGEDAELALDCGQGAMNTAIRFGNAMEPYDLAWLEDLIGYGTVEEYREITHSIKTATLTGEDRYTREAFRDLIERHAIRVIGPDLATAGGIAETKKIAELADLHGLRVALHFAGSPLSMMANVHVAATTPNVVAVEFHAVALPWWNSLVKGVAKPIIKDGYIEVPDGSGLGVELNEEEIVRHLKPGESYFG